MQFIILYVKVVPEPSRDFLLNGFFQFLEISFFLSQTFGRVLGSISVGVHSYYGCRFCTGNELCCRCSWIFVEMLTHFAEHPFNLNNWFNVCSETSFGEAWVSHRNKWIDMWSKSIEWFLYGAAFCWNVFPNRH